VHVIVKALSLWEPWASLMRAGLKRIETRCWYTGYRGPLLICASKRWTREERTATEDIAIDLEENFGIAWDRVVRPGLAVALVRLTGCVRTDRLLGLSLVAGAERMLGDYSLGRFCWCTEPICLDFEPFAVRGAQGLFEVEVPPELAAAGSEVAS
jgi:hypothetical protein